MSNAWITCPRVWDSPPKGGLIPHVIPMGHPVGRKAGVLRDLALEEGSKSYQLVGEVTAHQGNDGYGA